MSERIKMTAKPVGGGMAFVTLKFRETQLEMLMPVSLWNDSEKLNKAVSELFGGRKVRDAGS